MAYIRIELIFRSEILDIEDVVETLDLLSDECNFRDNDKDELVISSDMVKSFDVDEEILKFSKVFSARIPTIKAMVSKYQVTPLVIAYVETPLSIEAVLMISPKSAEFLNAIGARFEFEFLFDERYATRNRIRESRENKATTKMLNLKKI
jgi:hypothetical protein